MLKFVISFFNENKKEKNNIQIVAIEAYTLSMNMADMGDICQSDPLYSILVIRRFALLFV